MTSAFLFGRASSVCASLCPNSSYEMCLASIGFVLICLISNELGSDCLFSPATEPELSFALFLGGLWWLTLLEAQWFLSKQFKGGHDVTLNVLFLFFYLCLNFAPKIKFICG
jgi:hypothetical protein